MPRSTTSASPGTTGTTAPTVTAIVAPSRIAATPWSDARTESATVEDTAITAPSGA